MNKLNILNSSKKFNLIINNKRNGKNMVITSHLQSLPDDLSSYTKIKVNLAYTATPEDYDYLLSKLPHAYILLPHYTNVMQYKDVLAKHCRKITAQFGNPVKDGIYSIDEVRVIHSISEACAVSVSLLYLKSDDKRKYVRDLISLSQLFPRLDDVYLYMSGITTTEKYKIFRGLRDALSGWRMQIYLEAKDANEYRTMTEYARMDKNTRKGMRERHREVTL